MYVCMYVCVYMCVCVYVCMCVRVCNSMYMGMCMCICKYTYSDCYLAFRGPYGVYKGLSRMWMRLLEGVMGKGLCRFFIALCRVL